mgnify:CR=1
AFSINLWWIRETTLTAVTGTFCYKRVSRHYQHLHLNHRVISITDFFVHFLGKLVAP